MEVLLEGLLEKCVSLEQPKRDWKKRYFVLKHLLASNVRCLEYYRDKNWKKHEPKGVLTLHSGYEVVKVDEPKKKHAFDIRTMEHTFRLCADSDTEFNKWITTLQENNIVRSFNVISQATLNFQRLGINGPCILRITYTEIQLVSSDTRFQVVAWPLKCLRRYSSMGDEFIIEAGRKAPTGEGTFVFHSTESDVIFSLLDNLIRSKAGQTLVPQPQMQDPYNHIKRPFVKKDSIPLQTIKSVVKHNNQDNAYDSAYSHLKGTAHPAPSNLPPPPPDLLKEDSYDTLSFDKRLSQISNGSQLSADLEDSYSILQHEGTSKRASRDSTDIFNLEDTYDTLVHGMAPSQFQTSGSTSLPDQGDDMYNSLSQSAPLSTAPSFKPALYDEDTYDKLHSPANTPPIMRKAIPVKGSKSAPLSNDNSKEEYSALSHTTIQNKSKKGVQPPVPRRRTLSETKKGTDTPNQQTPPIPPARQRKHQNIHPSADSEDNYDVICASSPKDSKKAFAKCPLSVPRDETYDVIGQDTTLKNTTPLVDDNYDTLTTSDSGGPHSDVEENYSAINYDSVKPQLPPPLPKQRLDGDVRSHGPSSPIKHRNVPLLPPHPVPRKMSGNEQNPPGYTSAGEGVANVQTNMISQLRKTLESGGLDVTKISGKTISQETSQGQSNMAEEVYTLPEAPHAHVKKKPPLKPVRKC